MGSWTDANEGMPHYDSVLANPWLNATMSTYGGGSVGGGPPEAGGGSLAVQIVSDFGLSCGRSAGGSLPGYDIVNKDAYQMIQLSLAEELKNEEFYECYADENGTVQFYEIGTGMPSLNILYEFETGELKHKCKRVVVEGYDPPPVRFIRGPYDLFTFGVKFPNSTDPTFVNSLTGPRYWAWTDYLAPEGCIYAREGCIEYPQPFTGGHMNSSMRLAEAGIVNKREFENMVASFYKKTVPFYIQGSTNVEFQNTTTRYYTLNSFGTLFEKGWNTSAAYKSPLCMGETVPTGSEGVFLTDSADKNFLGVKAVYIHGYPIHLIVDAETIVSTAKPGTSGANSYSIQPMPGAKFMVDISTTLAEPISLTQGEDYVIVSKGGGGGYNIVFASNISPTWKKYFGGALSGGPNNLCISGKCIYDRDPNIDGKPLWSSFFAPDAVGGVVPAAKLLTGYLKSGQKIESNMLSSVCIFPQGEGTTGYAVNKIVVVYDWANPSIHITDVQNQVTNANLQRVKFEMYPIIIQDRPAPIAMNGQVLDPADAMPDDNVMTAQSFSTTKYYEAKNGLEAGDISVVVPFLDEGGCAKVSNFLYGLQQEIGTTKTYVCGPNSQPHLGESIDGLVVNAIDYSYQDSSQYYISVQAGPIWQGLSGWENAVYTNQTERVQVDGIVRGISSDNTVAEVQLEQFGIMSCLNGSADVLEVGDFVKVTLYNNPVGR